MDVMELYPELNLTHRWLWQQQLQLVNYQTDRMYVWKQEVASFCRVFLLEVNSADMKLRSCSVLFSSIHCESQRSQTDIVNDWRIRDQMWSAESFCSDGSSSLTRSALCVDDSRPSVTVGLYTLLMKTLQPEVTAVCVCVGVGLCLLTFHVIT